jgi:hypothetical protein
VAILVRLSPFGVHVFTSIWYILWLFGIYFPTLVCYNKKNLAALLYFDIPGAAHP